MTDLLPVSLEEEIAAVTREIGLRHRVYPGRVQSGRMKAERAEREIEIMEVILERLERVRDGR